jgi:hypothetical protein
MVSDSSSLTLLYIPLAIRHMCSDDEGPCIKRVVKFFLESSLELEELDSPPLVHSRTMIVAFYLGLLSLTTFFLGLFSILVNLMC